MEQAQLEELLLQALETEIGGEQIYETAISCAVNDDLRTEWEQYLDQTRHHRQVLQNVFGSLGLDPARRSPGREVVGHLGQSFVAAMEMAKAAGPAEAAQLVAGECVVLAETKDHLNWELIGAAAEASKGDTAEVLAKACEEVEDQEDEHLYHSTGWTRELWLESLGMAAVLPPPEEQKHVKTAIGAARAKQQRDDLT